METNIYIHCFPQVHDDIFSPLSIQGGGVNPPHGQTFFATLKAPQLPKFPQYFQVKTPMLQWIILNLHGNFLAFYNHLVSQVRDLMRPSNFWKYVSLTNKVYLWNHSIFDDICKNLFLVCNLHNNHFT